MSSTILQGESELMPFAATLSSQSHVQLNYHEKLLLVRGIVLDKIEDLTAAAITATSPYSEDIEVPIMAQSGASWSVDEAH